MASELSKKEIQKITNTLVCLAKGTEGYRLKVHQQNGVIAEGLVDKVDGYMNYDMRNVRIQLPNGSIENLDQMLINSRKIKYIEIPKEMNIKRTMENQLRVFNKPVQKYLGKKGTSNLMQKLKRIDDDADDNDDNDDDDDNNNKK
ncbi:unnamed protein product [Dimorphilus gyrociliatus]|uniref:Sm domain-containing protein n=1 Tax=Dimorphilus gyrociliatus TaxID=2664684 RepID=A0A7I8VNC7_9ANNE|nr:unnamed protein product [Dimorphilus gyrociliatus]